MTDVSFLGRLVMVGFGAIGQGALPLLLRHIAMQPSQITILTADESGLDEARAYGVQHQVIPLNRENYQAVLDPLLRPGDFLLNTAVGVSSAALIAFCRERNALYLDLSTDPWAGGYTDQSATLSARSNYRLRQDVLALQTENGPTAVLTHGANPGWVSHFVKQALVDLARDCGMQAHPSDRYAWARLARDLGIRTIHISERDWQIAVPRRNTGEFLNTWSVEGFVSESTQPAELGWGSHEKQLPPDGRRHGFGSEAAIYLTCPGAETRVRTWTPLAGPMHGFLITHSEAISIADYLTLGSGAEVEYRPTVHYAYHPCDDAVTSLHELAGREWRMQDHVRVVRDQIVGGIDELGVLLLGNPRGAYWYGSRLSTEEARRLAPCNSATTLQVAAGLLAGVIWAMRNPAQGIVEPEQLPHDQLIGLCRPYLGEIVGVYSDWTPLRDRTDLFPQNIDATDPWQFRNFRVGLPATSELKAIKTNRAIAPTEILHPPSEYLTRGR